jgi:hypothetical protein
VFLNTLLQSLGLHRPNSLKSRMFLGRSRWHTPCYSSTIVGIKPSEEADMRQFNEDTFFIDDNEAETIEGACNVDNQGEADRPLVIRDLFFACEALWQGGATEDCCGQVLYLVASHKVTVLHCPALRSHFCH